MTWLAVAYPEAERVGILTIPTTRGDRLFVSLILAAVIHLLWIAFIGTDALTTLQIREVNPGLRVRQSLQRRNNMRRLESRTGPNASKAWASRVLMMTSAVALM